MPLLTWAPRIDRGSGTRADARRSTSHRRGPRRLLHPADGLLLPSAGPCPTGPAIYLTTAIAYANNQPGLHTLYEVIGADAIARWHRMVGDDTRFLTGTDEHSINIAQSAVDEGRPTREFVDEKVALFKAAEDALAHRPGPVHPDDRSRPRPGGPGDGPPGLRQGRHLPRHVRGLVLPERGLPQRDRGHETARGTICPNHPEVPLQWLTERNWFFRLSAYQERLERYFADHPDFVQPDFRRNEMLGFIRGGLEDFSISRERTPGDWGIPFPIAENGETAAARGRLAGTPRPGTIYVWYDALINYITGAGFPDDPAAFARWWPADLHVIGKDIARFHTIFWPAMLWSAGLEAPRQVWVHGWLLAAGGERMSKSRGNFLDPNDFVAAFGADGARYVALREVPFDRDAEVSWDSFVRRYNADLANDFGNLVNRTVSMAEPLPRRRATGAATGAGIAAGRGLGGDARARYARAARGLPAPRRAGRRCGSSSAARTRLVDAEQPWVLAKAVEGRRRGGRGSACAASSATSSRRAGWSASPPRRSCPGPRRGSSPSSATRTRTAPTATAARRSSTSSLGRPRRRARARSAAPEPLFPRLDVEAETRS